VRYGASRVHAIECLTGLYHSAAQYLSPVPDWMLHCKYARDPAMCFGFRAANPLSSAFPKAISAWDSRCQPSSYQFQCITGMSFVFFPLFDAVRSWTSHEARTLKGMYLVCPLNLLNCHHDPKMFDGEAMAIANNGSARTVPLVSWCEQFIQAGLPQEVNQARLSACIDGSVRISISVGATSKALFPEKDSALPLHWKAVLRKRGQTHTIIGGHVCDSMYVYSTQLQQRCKLNL